MNCKNSKTSSPHRLFLDLRNKINLKRSNESNPSITIHAKTQ